MSEHRHHPRLDRHARYRGEYPIVVEGLVNRFGEHTIHEGLDLKVRRGGTTWGGGGGGPGPRLRSL